MVNYNESTIYKLCCRDPSVKDEYVGCTTNFTRRKCQHKSACNITTGKSYNTYVYQFIRENGGWDNWSMIEIEQCCVDNRKKLLKRERFWFETLGPSLNKNIPNRSREEYEQEDSVKLRKATYRLENKDKRDIWLQENKDKIRKTSARYNTENKEKRNLYRQENKEKMKLYATEYYKEYYQKNKDKYNQKKKDKL
jgi:hypothetical protein